MLRELRPKKPFFVARIVEVQLRPAAIVINGNNRGSPRRSGRVTRPNLSKVEAHLVLVDFVIHDISQKI